MINVTKTYLPDFQEYCDYLKKIWKSSWITNNGPYVKKLEQKLGEYLGVKYLSAVTNGTIGLQIAIKSLNLAGEIITTPFSYVASTSSIVWEGCKPVFVDIDPNTLCLDANKIEKAITKKTSAILAVHVYGNACNVEQIDKIAKKHNLKIIYDSAHAFGVKYKGETILNYGDVNVLSFHATKIFHTAEGGAVVVNNPILAEKISYLRNFGHKGEEDFLGLGINGKMSELHAAMGLAVLSKVRELIKKRKNIAQLYDKYLSGISIKKPAWNPFSSRNYGYYPVLFESEKQLLKVIRKLNVESVFPRRYFYPALTKLPYIKDGYSPIAENFSKRILCLPLSHALSPKDIQKIVGNITSSL